MAERRMFSKKVVSSDAFLNLTPEAQALYFQFGIAADDDGFINNHISIARMCGFGKEQIEELVKNEFIILFPNGLIVITHWKICNYIQKDRYIPTQFKSELEQLKLENKIYKIDDS